MQRNDHKEIIFEPLNLQPIKNDNIHSIRFLSLNASLQQRNIHYTKTNCLHNTTKSQVTAWHRQKKSIYEYSLIPIYQHLLGGFVQPFHEIM